MMLLLVLCTILLLGKKFWLVSHLGKRMFVVSMPPAWETQDSKKWALRGEWEDTLRKFPEKIIVAFPHSWQSETSLPSFFNYVSLQDLFLLLVDREEMPYCTRELSLPPNKPCGNVLKNHCGHWFYLSLILTYYFIHFIYLYPWI